MRKWFKHLKNQKGLTLIELLAVVVILGIIAAIAVPSIGNIIDNTKKDAHVANALLVINATKLGNVSNDSVIKTKLATKVKLEDLVKQGFLDSIPKDPGSDNATYKNSSYVKLDNGKYVIFLDGSVLNVGTTGTPAKEQDLNADGRGQVKE